MSLASEYQRQFAWRDWRTAFAALPDISGQLILDLGCGVGDQAAELAARGARIIGVDANEDLLHEARARCIANAEFRQADLRELADLGVIADGLWSSFTPAYFPRLSDALSAWSKHLRPGGWIALTEMDDLFAHQPLSTRTRSLLDAYARAALAAGRYDFHMGRKLRDHLERARFVVSRVTTVDDQELAFQGAAKPEVVDAWRARLDRMQLLREFCGSGFEQLRDELLACLADEKHTSQAKVYLCVALWPA